MKKTLILSIAIFSFIFAKSQPAWKWAYESGGSTATNNYDVTYGVTKDANYNIISCGIYQGSNIAIGNNTFTSANRNMWVGKQDVNGQWLWSISGDYATSNQAIYVYGVTTNSVGDVIVCGNHTGNVNIGGWAMSQSIGVNDGFVMKLNGNTGAVIWIIPLETKTYVTCAVTPLSVTCDASNNIFVAGQYKGYVKIGGITNLSSSSNTTGYTYDGMVAKINNAGTCLWFKSVYSDVAVGNADKTCFNIATDAAGNVYTVGYFANTVARLDATFSVTNSGVATTNDAFLAKYSNNGIPMNIWRFASSNTSSQDYLFGIDLMPDGNLALCGAFLSKAIVYKVNISDGTILNTIEPTGSTSNSTLYDIDSDASGNLYSCGSVQGVSPGLMG